MSLEFILQLAYSTCYNCLSSSLIDRDPDSLFAASWTYEDGWKLLLHDTYYTTSSTTQNTLSSYLSKLQTVPDSIFTFGSRFHGLLQKNLDPITTATCERDRSP